MEPSPSPDVPGATAPDLDQLVALAADAVAAAVAGGDAPAPDAVRLSPALAARGGAFVTLTVDGRLNGCIGTLDPAGPLGAEVVRLALDAAFADPRLPALTERDLPGLEVEVSLLSAPEPVPAATRSELLAHLRPGVDGLILTVGRRRALFLPDVWAQVPDPDAFVGHLLVKAGLAPHGWPEGIRALRFTTVARRRALRELRPDRPRPPRSGS